MPITGMEIQTEVIDMGEAAILRQIEDIGNGSSVTVGYHDPEASKLPTYNGNVDGNVKIVTYAAWNEFGKKNQVPRPTLGPTLANNAVKYQKQTANLMRKMYMTNGMVSVEDILNIQGKRAVKWTKSAIKNFSRPQNTANTIRWKVRMGRGTRPLTLSGSMAKAVGYRVEMSRKKNTSLTKLIQKQDKAWRKLQV